MIDKYAEHLRDSAPDNSRFDGFDRGDEGNDEGNEVYGKVIGRMHCWHGKVEIVEVVYPDGDSDCFVQVNGRQVTDFIDRARAIVVGRWWVNGCNP
jgi:hypothetical protein